MISNTKLKVSILITRLDLGGAQEVALETAARLDPTRFDVELLAGAGGMLDEEATRRLGVRFVRVPFFVHPVRPLRDVAAFVWLWWHFVRRRSAVVHTHSSKAGLLGRLAAWLARVPVIVHTVHGWSFNDTQGEPAFRVFVWIERVLAKLTDALAVVAASCREKGLLQGVGQAGQYTVLRAGVDVSAWRATARSKAALNAALRVKPGGPVVGCIGNLKAQKDPLTFVAVAAQVLKRVPRARFVMIGDGPLRAAAEALAVELGCAGRVHFLGWQAEPRALAAGFDVFLLTSMYEGLPCVFPQALSLGLPVVATNVDGAAEIVKEGKNGYLCQPRDIEALADRVAGLLQRPTLLRRLRLAAKASVGKEFTVEDMVSRTAEIYLRGQG